MITIMVNAKSGAAEKAGPEALAEVIETACREAGLRDVDLQMIAPERVDEAVAKAFETADEVWIGGGDDTLRAAAPLAMESGKPMGVVPLGTMNLLARDLGIPLDPAEAIAALAAAPVKAIDVGLMNDTPFLNKSALGLYPEMIIDRERRRRLFGYGKWSAMLRAAWRALRRHRMMDVTLEAKGERRQIRSPALVVATSAYLFRAGQVFARPELDSGRLTLYLSHEKSWLGSLGQMMKLFLGTLHRDKHLEILSVDHLEIDFRHSRPVANDGEVDFVRGPVRYAIAAGALKVRYPEEEQAEKEERPRPLREKTAEDPEEPTPQRAS